MNWLFLPFILWFLTFIILITFFSWIFFTQFWCCIFQFFFYFRYWYCLLFLRLFSFINFRRWNYSWNIEFHNFFLGFFQFLNFWLIILNQNLIILNHVLSMFHYLIEKYDLLYSLTSYIHNHFEYSLTTFCVLSIIKACDEFTFFHYVVIYII